MWIYKLLSAMGWSSLGIIIGILISAFFYEKDTDYDDILQDTYDRGYEDGQNSVRGNEDGEKR